MGFAQKACFSAFKNIGPLNGHENKGVYGRMQAARTSHSSLCHFVTDTCHWPHTAPHFKTGISIFAPLTILFFPLWLKVLCCEKKDAANCYVVSNTVLHLAALTATREAGPTWKPKASRSAQRASRFRCFTSFVLFFLQTVGFFSLCKSSIPPSRGLQFRYLRVCDVQ